MLSGGGRKMKNQRAEALRIWAQSGEKFRNLVLIYTELLEEKRRAKIEPLGVIPKDVLRSYPKNAFLEIETKEAAESYLSSLSDTEVSRLLRELERIFTYDYSYITISTRVYDFKRQLKRGRSVCSLEDRRNPCRFRHISKKTPFF